MIFPWFGPQRMHQAVGKGWSICLEQRLLAHVIVWIRRLHLKSVLHI